jgi:hypothetical protein
MHFIGTELSQLERSLRNFSVEALAKYLKPSLIEEALKQTGRASRRVRKLPAGFVVWLVICLGVFRRLSIQNVIARLGKPLGGVELWEEEPSSAAVTTARNRLGVEPMSYVAGKLSELLRKRFGSQLRWRGMELLIIDGTTLKVQDSPENEKYFGRPGASRGKAGYPQMRAAFLLSATHRFIWGYRFAPYHTGEVTMAGELIEQVPAGFLVLLDRNFYAYKLLVRLLERGAHFVVRIKKNAAVRKLCRVGRGDYIVEFAVPRYLKRGNPVLPEKMVLRMLVIKRKGAETIYLLTSLTDPGIYRKSELSNLYLERWEIENSIDEVKTHQVEATTVNRPVIFRSKSPERVLQEAHGLIIAYNLIHALIAEGAERAGVEPVRISFVSALARVREAIPRMASAPTRQLPYLYKTLIKRISEAILPARRARSNPRVVKVKMSAYKLKRSDHAA